MQLYSPNREFTFYTAGHFLPEDKEWKELLKKYEEDGAILHHKEKLGDSCIVSGVTKKGNGFYYRFCIKDQN